MITIYQHIGHSPIGPMTILSTETGICFLDFTPTADMAAERFIASHFPIARQEPEGGLTKLAEKELEDYFAGNLARFTVPVELIGTTFQRRVLNLVAAIPYGTTKTYGQIARELGQPGASRAVGGANMKNPIPIIIPCHRVVASGGLGGYGGKSGNTSIKRKLLELEGAFAGQMGF